MTAAINDIEGSGLGNGSLAKTDKYNTMLCDYFVQILVIVVH